MHNDYKDHETEEFNCQVCNKVFLSDPDCECEICETARTEYLLHVVDCQADRISVLQKALGYACGDMWIRNPKIEKSWDDLCSGYIARAEQDIKAANKDKENNND